ncbi:MAG: PEP-CTERM sorting domain-containing protein [Rhodocyclaceae bacterium]|nr:PEP-CTERM sorting domain-containing protein [Rhodocyclaceae bacterium]
MTKKIALKLLAAATCVLGVATQANAANITVYANDLTGWSAAAGALGTLETFDDGTLVPGLSITFGSSLGGNISGGWYNDRADDTQATVPQFAFTAPVAAFGADWDLAGPGGSGTGIKLHLVFSDLTEMDLATEVPATLAGGFWGFVSDAPIASFSFHEGGQSPGFETFRLDNARFSPASSVPEPASLALVSLGLAGLAFRRKDQTR